MINVHLSEIWGGTQSLGLYLKTYTGDCPRAIAQLFTVVRLT